MCVVLQKNIKRKKTDEKNNFIDNGSCDAAGIFRMFIT
jgi:hypothetical protein